MSVALQSALDNPIWNGLITGNKHLARGNEHVKYFSEKVSPFAGFDEISLSNFKSLYDQKLPHRFFATFTLGKIEIPAPWKVIHSVPLVQMIFDRPLPPGFADPEIILLDQRHVPAMLSLTKITNPGPFSEQTLQFGNYAGIFRENELVAMAGQRLHIGEYIEVSAVCTHPDHLGKGYASRLIRYQLDLIKKDKNTPILHAREDNLSAIKLYQNLGFSIRQSLVVTTFQK